MPRFCRAPLRFFYSRLQAHHSLPRIHADLAIRGTPHSVDQYLNIKLLTVSVEDVGAFPHMQSVKNCSFVGR